MPDATHLTVTTDARSRVMAVVSRIAPVYPKVAESLIARLDMYSDDESHRRPLVDFSREAEAMQAALILGLASTHKGNNIKQDNLDQQHSNTRLFDPRGAVKALYQGRES